MGEYAEMMLDGECCEACGVYLGGGNGHPQRCPDCHHEITTAEVEKELGRGAQDGRSN